MRLFSRRREVSVELGPAIFEALHAVMSDSTGMTRHKNVSYGGIEIKNNLQALVSRTILGGLHLGVSSLPLPSN
jgi:hypothetical protein